MYLGVFVPIDQFRLRIIWLTMPNLQGRIKLLKRFANTYIEDTKSIRRFNSLMRRVSKLASRRNMIAHALGGANPETGEVMFFNDADDDDLGVNFLRKTHLNLQDIEQWPKAIRNLQDDMMCWLPHLQASISTSTKMHRQEHPD